nr:serine-protein kinase ATM-like isoform X1 [Procambarus clarkii]XP_045624833.1 serine-protein kinase ATM-like isoform X1 [Procambarus clarkii]
MALDTVKQCCRQLDSDRITERKKGSDQLKHLLNNPSIVGYLDTRPNDCFNWNSVFWSAKTFFIKESKRVEEDERKKSEVSQTVLQNRANLKRCAAALPKLVMKKSSLRTPRVSAHIVVDLVLTVLDRSNAYLLENFAGDFIQITFKYLLRFPQYYLEVSPAKWRDLMKIFIWVYENDLPNTDAVTIIGVMEGIVKCCKMQGIQHRIYNPALVLRRLPAFLKRALTSSKLPSQFGLQSSLLSLLLTFTKAMSSEWRYLLCSIGEETFNSVLAMWESHSSPRQTNWLEYVNLQILIHHPQKGGETIEVSQFVHDSVKWQRCLHHLYQLVHDHLDQLTMKNKLASSSALNVDHYTIPTLLVTLTARLCCKIFQDNNGYGVLDVTQDSSNDNSNATGNKPNKRRRIEVGLQPLVCLLREEGTQLHTIPWYQILHELLKSYSAFFDQAKCSMMLELFTHTLSECRKPAIQEHVIWCLCALAHQYNKVYHMSGTENEKKIGKWTPVWDMTLRLVSGKQCSRSGLELLQTLMETGLAHPSSSVFKLFYQGYVDMNATALSTLLVLLSLVPVPKHVKDESSVLSDELVKDGRIKLLHIVLPVHREGGIVNGGMASVASLENPVLLAQLLLQLRLRDPSCAESEWTKIVEFKKESRNSHNKSDFLSHLEDIYRLSTFSCDLPKNQLSKNNSSKLKTSFKELKILHKEEECMIERIIAFVEQVETEDILTISNGLQVLLQVLQLIVIVLLHISDQRLQMKLQQVMKLVTSGIQRMCSVPSTCAFGNVLPVLELFQHLFHIVNNWAKSLEDPNAKSNGEKLQELLLSSTPPALFACIIELVKARTTKSLNDSQPGISQLNNNMRRSVSQGSSTDLDLDFDDFDEAGPSVSMKDDFQQFDEHDNNALLEATTDENIILEDISSYSLQDQCIILAQQWLSDVNESWCTVNVGEDSQNSLLDVINLIIEFSKYPNLETADIAVILKFVHTLFTSNYDEDNIKDGFEILSYLCKKHCSEPQVAAYVLKIITDLTRVHGNNLSAVIRASIVKLGIAFAQKQQEGIYGQSVSEAIFYLNGELSKVDPKRVWSRYVIPENDRCGEIFNLLCSPSHELRIMAASFIHVILVKADGTMMDTQHQLQTFQDVYQTALEALTLPGTLQDDFKSDEGVNRVASFLLTLGVIALNSPFLEAKALFALCLAVPECGVDAVLVSRLVNRVAISRGCTMKKLMQHHLPYLAKQWVLHNQDIANFPACLLESTNSENFLKEHTNILLPVLFDCDKSDSIENLARNCGKDVVELFKMNFPTLMAHIYPLVSAELNNDLVEQLTRPKIISAKRHYKLLEKSLGNERFREMIDKHIGDIILSLVKIVHDADAIIEEEVIVEPNPPYFSSTVIHNTLEYLNMMFKEACPLAVLASRKLELHKVVQGVLEYFAQSSTPHSARRALSSVAAVVHSLLPHLEENVKDISAYIIRFLVHILTCYTSSLQEIAPYLADHCNKLLYNVCSCALEHCPHPFISVIPILFARLLPLAKVTSPVKKSTLSVIEAIFTSNHPDVQRAVSGLPPLPDDEEFQSLNPLRDIHCQLVTSFCGSLTLGDEIKNFLSLSLDETEVQSVIHLLKMLQHHRTEIPELYESVGVDQESAGHRLTYSLVTLASGSDEQVALQASRCLGELGPISFGSPVFYIQDKNFSQLLQIGTMDCDIACNIITMLNRFLTCEDINVVQAAGSALQNFLSTRDGFKAFHDLGQALQQDLIVLLPISRPKIKSTSSSGVDANNYELLIGDCDLWFSGNSYEEWVTRLACRLIEAGCGSDIITQVLPVCKVKPEFSAFMLPFIIHSALKTNCINRRDVLSRQFSQFFDYHVDIVKLPSSSKGTGKNMCINKAALQVLLNVIDYLRTQTPDEPFSDRGTVTPWERNLWLQVNYLHVAQAAHYYGAHFSALLFLHLHCETLLNEMKQNQSQASLSVSGQTPLLMQITHLPEAATLSTLMLQVYSCLGDSDGVEGCVGASRLVDSSARAMRYQHRGQWMEAFAIHDSANCIPGIVEGLREMGLFNTLNALLSETSLKISQEVSEAQWESAWRLSQWDSVNFNNKFSEEGLLELKPSFHQQLFCALQSLHHQDLWSLHKQTMQARKGVIRQLRLSRAESSSSIYPLLSQLQILSEVEAASASLSDIHYPDKFKISIQNLEHMWNSKKTMANVEYKYKEPILAARISTLKTIAAVHNEENVNRILHTSLLTKSVLSRENMKLNNSSGSESALLWASRLKLPQTLVWMTRLEEAQVAKHQQHTKHASDILNSLIEDLHKVNLESEEKIIVCQALNLYGCVLMDSRARAPHDIIQDFFNKAIGILNSSEAPDTSKVLEDSYHQLATYADKHYREVHQHLESDAIQTKRETIKRSQEELTQVKNLRSRTKVPLELTELSKKINILEKNIKIDCNKLCELEDQKEEYLFLAMENYLKCVMVSTEHEMHIYRIVGLWLENLTNERINRLVLDHGMKMSSYHFVPLLYQLVARLSCQRDQHKSFLQVLLYLLQRVCVEHPHHSLPVIIALAHAHADDDIMKNGSKSKKQRNEVKEEDRVRAAKLLVSRLKKTAIAEHVAEFETVSHAYLELANWSCNMKLSPGTKVSVPDNQPLASLRNLKYTSALTRPLKLQPSAHYSPPLIVGWEDTCTFVGGINAPKRLTIKTSDGLKQFELLKGRDDIRQDAVMEQVFRIVNQLLNKNRETRERALSMRTYQAVPLSQKSGLIQWCNNTQAFGEYLIGTNKKGGAHKLYYPEDYTASACRERMNSVKERSFQDRFNVFQDILEHFHPVFRHFFLENYPSPHEWYKRRLAYTKSVATSSMVGYILGLGDRHVENILLDKSTAELVHIDLGIAFELGKILPTPETVPFRMTQDIIDGLGVMGVEGPLRQCCEATLAILRSSGEVLVTVVEVLRHDPLHQWTLSPQQVAHLQASGDDDDQAIGCVSSASMADRVVLRVQQKLAGVEDGYPRTVAEQVTVLLQQATDNSNLSRLFPGWQPYI